jgi:type VI secretion system protein ImpG
MFWMCSKLGACLSEYRPFMEKNVLHYYEQELRFIRELGLEFVRKFPKVAGRLGLGDQANTDPHVERLFQGFAFFAGRVRQRLESEFPALTEPLLDHVYPHYLKPTPSMAVVQFRPTPGESSLLGGYTVPRGTELRARYGAAGGSVCQYQTAHDVQLWPISIEHVEYTSVLSSIADLHVPTRDPIVALLRIGLRLTSGRSFSELPLRSLPLYVGGNDETSARIYEALAAHAMTTVLRWGPLAKRDVAYSEGAHSTRLSGFDDEQALLPAVPAAFRGYRLLHEYFAFPARFHGVELIGLGTGVQRCASDRLELIVPLKHHNPALEGKLGLDRLQLFATPIVNLFSRRIVIAAGSGTPGEVQLVPDHTQPLDFEIHSVTRISAHTHDGGEPRTYGRGDEHDPNQPERPLTRYKIERRPPLPRENEHVAGARSDYRGTEVYLTLGESDVQPSQFAVDTLCTNRDLPVLLAKDRRSTFTLSIGAPVDEVRLLAGPSAPRYVPHDGETTWQLISHLQLSYLGLGDSTGGSEALRELLGLYARIGDPLHRREVDGLREIKARSVIGPYPAAGPRHFVRGLEIQLHCEDQAFVHGALTLSAVLSQFFAKHASDDSFTQTVLHTRQRGEVHRWPATKGQGQRV